MKSIYLQKDKSIFKLGELPVDKFAEALGLPGTPKIKFLRKEAAKKKKNAPRVIEPVEDEDEDEEADEADSETSAGEDDDDASEDASEKAPAKVSRLLI
jgi:ATP-dependent RNA helicase DDX10/DBP4